MSRRSREIGWGPAEITLWEIQRALNCSCKPVTTPTEPDCATGGTWVSHEDDLYSSYPGINYTNSIVDSSCNVYTLWSIITMTSREALVQKRDSSGAILWQKQYTTFNGEVQYGTGGINIVLDSNQNPIISGWGQIVKLDPTGAVTWNNTYTGPNLNEFTGIAVDSENNIVANGSVYAYSPEVDATIEQLYVAKFNGSTGAVITEKYFYDVNQGTVPVAPYSVPWTNGTNVYVLPTGSYTTVESSGYQGVAIKLDTTLTEVWNAKILNKDVISGDQDGTAIRVFPDGGVLLTAYGQAIIKLDSAGSFVWSAVASGGGYLPDAVVASDGSVYQFGDSETVGSRSIVHFKADGTYDWAYSLDNPTDGMGTWDVIPQELVYKNKTLYLSQPKNTLKLPLTQVPDGTYGNYTVAADTYVYTNPVVPMSSTTLTRYNTTEWANNSTSATITVVDATYTQTNVTI